MEDVEADTTPETYEVYQQLILPIEGVEAANSEEVSAEDKSVEESVSGEPAASSSPSSSSLPVFSSAAKSGVPVTSVATTAALTTWGRSLQEYQLFYKVKRVMPKAKYSMIEDTYATLLEESALRKWPPRHALDRLLARVAQQRMMNILRSQHEFAELEPPGSQIDLYDLGEDGRPTTVWYASYGSNMSRDARFMHYLQGGTPEGGAKEHKGARDKSEPLDDVRMILPGTVYYACSSKAWGGGGSAFYDYSDTGEALSRAYRITAEQFDDVALQENNGDPSTEPVTLDLASAIAEGSLKTKGRYSSLVHVGDYDGAPVFTLTGDFTVQDALGRKKTLAKDEGTVLIEGREKVRKQQKRKVRVAKILRRVWIPIKPIPVDHDVRVNAPSKEYEAMMSKGLQELGLNEEQVARYFRGATGYPLPQPEKTTDTKSAAKTEPTKLVKGK